MFDRRGQGLGGLLGTWVVSECRGNIVLALGNGDMCPLKKLIILLYN